MRNVLMASFYALAGFVACGDAVPMTMVQTDAGSDTYAPVDSQPSVDTATPVTTDCPIRFTVENVGWLFWSSVGPLSEQGWPIGDWDSCSEMGQPDCTVIRACTGEAVLMNVQSIPANDRPWALGGSWNGQNWCSNPDVDDSMFVGKTPAEMGCDQVCSPSGTLNWLCRF